VGLVPRQNSTGGKNRLGGISKRGNSALRHLLVGGAMAALFRTKAPKADPWLCRLRARKPVMVAAVAFANKIARTVRAVMRYDQDWRSGAIVPTAQACRRARRRQDHAAVSGGLRPVLTAAVHDSASAIGRDGETVSCSNRETHACEGKTS
jgi:hypothetical protein